MVAKLASIRAKPHAVTTPHLIYVLPNHEYHLCEMIIKKSPIGDEDIPPM